MKKNILVYFYILCHVTGAVNIRQTAGEDAQLSPEPSSGTIPNTAEDTTALLNNMIDTGPLDESSCVYANSSVNPVCIEKLNTSEPLLAQPSEIQLQDKSLFLDILNATDSESPLDEATTEIARVAGLDIKHIDNQAQNDAHVTDLTNITLPDPSHLQGRDLSATDWTRVAEARAREKLYVNLARLLQIYNAPAIVVSNLNGLGMCDEMSRSMIDTCKQGVRTQVANCKQRTRDSIAQCKDDVGRKIDACKKRYSKWDPRKLSCEPQRPKLLAECEIRRLNVPFCEFDRLNAACCEGTRPQAQSMCYAGLSASEIEKQSQSVQQKCAIIVAIAKSATKSYLSGQVVGILSQIKTVREIQQGTELVQRLQRAQRDYQSSAQGVTAVTEGRIKDAEQMLGIFRSQLPSPVSDTVDWGNAAQASTSKKTNELLKAACGAVADIQVIAKAVDQIEELKAVQRNLLSIQSAAGKCTWKTQLNPENFGGFNHLTSEAQVNAAVVEYERTIGAGLREFAQCRAVFDRVTRVINMKF